MNTMEGAPSRFSHSRVAASAVILKYCCKASRLLYSSLPNIVRLYERTALCVFVSFSTVFCRVVRLCMCVVCVGVTVVYALGIRCKEEREVTNVHGWVNRAPELRSGERLTSKCSSRARGQTTLRLQGVTSHSLLQATVF